MVRLTDGLDMTIAVDRDIEPKTKHMLFLSCENLIRKFSQGEVSRK